MIDTASSENLSFIGKSRGVDFATILDNIALSPLILILTTLNAPSSDVTSPNKLALNLNTTTETTLIQRQEQSASMSMCVKAGS